MALPSRAHWLGESAVSCCMPVPAGMIRMPRGPATMISSMVLIAAEHVAEVSPGRQAQHHVDVAEAEVGVEHGRRGGPGARARRPG